jgi:hypothetical protein
MAPWKLPLIVAAIAVPVIGAFAVGGAGVGVAVGALSVVAIVVIAAAQRPRGPIGALSEHDAPRRVLLVVTRAVEAPAAVQRIALAAGVSSDAEDAEVLVLAPARIGFLDRWASDVEGARRVAQQNLVATVAALAKAGIAAEARVGDEDVVQAVEDQLQSFAASDVVLVGDGDGADSDAAAVAELESRLRARFRYVSLDSG